MEAITMSRESDRLMLKLPLADVAEWLRAELRDCPDTTPTFRLRQTILRNLIAKLGQDETKGEDDER
jgi:hypothetical protein